jgi:molecular chaperone DnaK
MKGDDKDTITAKTEALATASHKMAEQMYAQAQQAGGAAGAASGAQASTAEGKAKGNENVVDAEFSEVKDDKKK